MSEIQYIRDFYHVPAKIGGRVLFEGKPGTIIGTYGAHLKVRPDERKYKGTRWHLHPTWHVEYLAPDGSVLWADKRLAEWKGGKTLLPAICEECGQKPGYVDWNYTGHRCPKCGGCPMPGSGGDVA